MWRFAVVVVGPGPPSPVNNRWNCCSAVKARTEVHAQQRLRSRRRKRPASWARLPELRHRPGCPRIRQAGRVAFPRCLLPDNWKNQSKPHASAPCAASSTPATPSEEKRRKRTGISPGIIALESERPREPSVAWGMAKCTTSRGARLRPPCARVGAAQPRRRTFAPALQASAHLTPPRSGILPALVGVRRLSGRGQPRPEPPRSRHVGGKRTGIRRERTGIEGPERTGIRDGARRRERTGIRDERTGISSGVPVVDKGRRGLCSRTASCGRGPGFPGNR
jgi:hypothetical protein